MAWVWKTTGAACWLLAWKLLLVSAQIRVLAPASLMEHFRTTGGRIQGSTATFGAPFYGERLLGQLVWDGSKKGRNHCRGEDYSVPPQDHAAVERSEKSTAPLLQIVLVRRGNCSFVTKVRVAQEKGAHAVIIVDKEDSTLGPRDIQRIIVADDGYGSTVEIPSLLISREEGQYLIEAATSRDAQVILELAWDVPTNHVVVVDLWMSSASKASLQFLREFAPNRKALNEAIKFVPHYHVFGIQSGEDYHDLCENDADKSAAYCAEDPDGSGPITGRMVLDEDVRQLCIHDIYKVTRDDLEIVQEDSVNQVEYSKEYWDYVERLLDRCPLDHQDDNKRFGKVCSEALMREVGIDVDRITSCSTDATRRKKMLLEQKTYLAWSPRALRINQWRYSGTMDADLVTRAICAGFIKQPRACKDLVEPVNHFARVQPRQGSGVGLGTFVTALLVVAVVALAAMFLYKRALTRHIHSALREEVMLEVQAQMESYKQLAS